MFWKIGFSTNQEKTDLKTFFRSVEVEAAGIEFLSRFECFSGLFECLLLMFESKVNILDLKVNKFKI